jgi:anti-sigma regulatory factor (Ser/Thr protein kinase)
MNMQKAIVLEFPLIEADFEMVGEASSKIKQALNRSGIRSDVVRRIVISAYEAAMNVVIHAYHGKLRAVIFRDHTELSISDDGPGIPDIDAAMRMGYSTAPECVREMGFGAGSGLVNIARYPDECTIKSVMGAGTTIHLVIRH